MDNKVKQALQNAVTSSIYAFFPLSELPIKPFLKSDNIIFTDATHFITAWYSDGDAYETFDPDEADDVKNTMITELIDQLRSRNIVSNVIGTVVQEFDWKDKHYDVDKHGINYLVILCGEITEKIGSIYKNAEDRSCEQFEVAMEGFRSKYLEILE